MRPQCPPGHCRRRHRLPAVPLAAQVAVSASATLDNFRIQLFDTDPLDGIAPRITFSSGVGISGSTALAGVQQSIPVAAPLNLPFGATAFAPVSMAFTLRQAQASASITGTGLPDGTGFSASGSAANTAGSAAADFNGFGAIAIDSTRLLPFLGLPELSIFTLSAHTVAVFTGTASLSASATGGAEPNADLLRA